MGKRRAVLGIDLGTSQVKALVMAPDGEILGRGRAGYRVVSPGEGLAETDPAEWWRATVAAVREALADAGADVEVVAVGVDGQMHGVVLAGVDGNAVRPAILWLDRRAEAEAARYGELPAELTRPLGNQASAGMAGPMLSWLAAHEPDVLRRPGGRCSRRTGCGCGSPAWPPPIRLTRPARSCSTWHAASGRTG